MTKGQRNTLDNVRAFFEAHGRSPTIRELMAIEGVKSTAGIYERLQTLVRDGYLRKLDDHHGRYVPVDHSYGVDLRGCSTAALKAELQRRGEIASVVLPGRVS